MSEATKQSSSFVAALDCFAEPVTGPAKGRTRWLAMTDSSAAPVTTEGRWSDE
jgi:hypothetical protein